MEDVEVSIAVAYKGDMVTTGEYSTELDIVLAVPVEIPFVSELNWEVDSSDSIDEVWSVLELNGVVNIDVCDDIELLFNAVAAPVDNGFVCAIEERLLYSDTSGVDVTTVAVESANTTVLLLLKVPIVVSSFNSGCDELKVERCSCIVENVLDKDSVNCELVVETDSV